MPDRRSKRTRKAKARQPKLFRTLLSTTLLVIAGFAVGLVSGALFEKPATVLAPFRSGGETIDLAVLENPTGETAPPGSTIAAAAVSAPLALEPPAERTVKLEKRAPLAPVAAPPPAGPFAIQVGSFDEPVPAWKLAEQLGEKEYDVYVDEGEAAGKPRWRVRVGPVPDQDQADRLARRLKSKERLPTWVVAEEDRG